MSKNHTEIDEAFMREARIGLMVLMSLLAVLLYVAFGKLSGWHRPQPMAFQDQEPAAIQTANDRPDALPSQPPSAVRAIQPIDAPPSQRADSNHPPAVTVPGALSNDLHVAIPAETVAVSPQLNTPERPHSSLKIRGTRTSARPDPTANQTRHQPPNQLRFPPQRPPSLTGNRFQPNLSSANPPINNGFRTNNESGFQPESGFRSDAGFKPPQPMTPVGVDSEILPASFNQPEPEPQPTVSGNRDLAVANTDSGDHGASAPRRTLAEDKDSFWLIAQRVYGDGRYFNALYEANKDRVPSFNEIDPGTEILTPDVESLRQRWPRLCPRPQLITAEGDTLFQIAGDRLGQASRYVELMKINFRRLPKDIRHDTPLPVGITLDLPRR